MKKPNGQPEWIKRAKNNHFLDAEAMAAAAGYLLNVQRLSSGRQRGAPPSEPEVADCSSSAPLRVGAPAMAAPGKRDRFREFASRFNG